MANHDIRNDVAPAQTLKRPSLPTVAALRTALNTHSATSYSTDRLNGMSKNDMISAARTHGLSVAGL